MAATTEDGKKVDEVVGGEKSTGDEAVGDKIKMITLKSSDGESFEITHDAAALSNTIQHMIEDDCVENGVPLPNVNSKILAKVIEYCNKHAAAPAAAAAAAGGTSSDDTAATTGERDLKSFDAEFIEAVDWNTLFEIILAANYLAIQGLLDISCEKVADNIKDKTVEQVRKIFNIEGDFTPEEEADVRKENQWAFE